MVLLTVAAIARWYKEREREREREREIQRWEGEKARKLPEPRVGREGGLYIGQKI